MGIWLSKCVWTAVFFENAFGRHGSGNRWDDCSLHDQSIPKDSMIIRKPVIYICKKPTLNPNLTLFCQVKLENYGINVMPYKNNSHKVKTSRQHLNVWSTNLETLGVSELICGPSSSYYCGSERLCKESLFGGMHSVLWVLWWKCHGPSAWSLTQFHDYWNSILHWH